MMQYLIFLFVFLHSNVIFSQDERIFKSELIYQQPIEKITNSNVNFFSRGGIYKIDLNNDMREEGVNFVKSNGKDYFEIFNYKNEILYKVKFDPVGISSRLYKLKLIKLKFLNVILLYYYEGIIKGIETKSSIRLYVVSFNRDLKKFTSLKGPMIWKGFITFKKQLFEKKFKIIVKDSNFDGLKDILISTPHIHHVIFQTKNRKWTFF